MRTKLTAALAVLALGLLSAGMKVPLVAAQTPAASGSNAAPAYPTGAGTTLGQSIATILSDPAVARAHWGIAVTTLAGVPLYGHDEAQLFRPASNAKLFTTAAAMQLLGPQATVSTTVTADTLSAGVVHGNVYLRSDGDANLSGTVFPYAPIAGEPGPATDPLQAIDDLARQVAAHGVRRITGSVIANDTPWAWQPYPDSWAIDDMLWDYGAPVSSLSVNDSTIALTIHPGPHPGTPATVTQSPSVGFYNINIQATTTAAKSQTRINIDRAVGSRTVVVTGEIALGAQDVEQIAVSNPPLFAAQALRSRLLADGVQVEGTAHAAERTSTQLDSFSKQSHEPITALPTDLLTALPVAGTPLRTASATCTMHCGITLAQRTSPTLAQDVLYTLKVSQNLHAEQILRRLGEAYGTETSGAQGARVVRQFLLNAGLSGDDFVFYDGSGLSDHDLVTPRATTQLLAYAARQSWFPLWKQALPVGGVNGTLDNRFKDPPLKGHVFAKTGTLGESRALSGYLDCASGQQVIFSIFVDNHTPGDPTNRAAMDQIVATIAANE